MRAPKALALCLALCLALTACGGCSGGAANPGVGQGVAPSATPAQPPAPTTETSQEPSPTPDPTPQGPETWTLCLYLCGSNLETKQGWATKTLKELTGAALPENVTVAVQTGGARTWHTDGVTNAARWRIENNALTPAGAASSAPMGASASLGDFLTYCAETYPADHTAVVLWNHGGGPVKGACFDETNGYDALTLAELGEAFSAGVAARDGKPYDVIGFDACLMASLETAATLCDYGDYLVASEEIEPGAGWDYTVPLAAMGEEKPPAEVAAAICDGYLAKCESRGKAASATLSAIDLSKTGEIISALNNALADLREDASGKAAMLRYLSFRSRQALAFGGATQSEGQSNLIDLWGFARALWIGGGDAWGVLVNALEAAVVRQTHGEAMVSSHGLSIWYPRTFSRTELTAYAAATPLTAYAQLLEELFSTSLGQVAFQDRGSLREDGMFTVTIAPVAEEAFYDLYVVNRRVDGDYMDVNVDLEDDWDNLSFAYDPRWAVSITLNGMVLDAQTIAYDYDHILFSCPITLNGEESNLRIVWFWDSADSGHYELVGVWNGVDQITGISDRLLDQLQPGDVVGARSLSTGQIRETLTLSDGEPEIDERPMEPGLYECWFVCLDLQGKEVPSAVATYQVTEEGAQIISIE